MFFIMDSLNMFKITKLERQFNKYNDQYSYFFILSFTLSMKKQALQTEQDLAQSYSSQDFSAALELQGQTKIASLIGIRWSWLKFALLIVPVIILLVPLLLLKYFKWLRVMFFYTQCTLGEASSLYIETVEGVDDIVDFIQEKHKGSKVFMFKSLKYYLAKQRAIPIHFDVASKFFDFADKIKAEKGLSSLKVEQQRKQFGQNKHAVQTPWYPEYMFQVMTKPFFLLQYFICVVWILQNIWIFAVIMLVFSVITTTINYILLYVSFRKIKEIAEKVVKVQVIRNGKKQEIDSNNLVPGDIFIPQNQLPCDGVLIQGQTYVNEASLTGESVPIGKFPVDVIESLKEGNRWLNQGSIVLQSRGNALAMVVNIGYGTRRGRIIRKILTRVTKAPDFFKTALIFLVQTLIIGIIIYLASLPLLLRLEIVPQYVVYRFLDFLGWTFPPPLPIYFNLAYSFSLGRLRNKNINGTEPQKTVEAAKLKAFCFDKTGTLTENAIEVHEIIKFKSEDQYCYITDQKQDPANQMIWKFFATCHTVKEINGQFLGDQVDLRMFLFTGYKMKVTQDSSIKFIAENDKGERLQVLRVNQFESKFQSMSVLVKDVKSNKYFALLKGAPQKVERNSTLKVKAYQSLVAKLSLGGYRTIGYGFKEVPLQQLQTYLTGPRESFQTNIRAMGLVAFENKLKHDTRQTILSLVSADIEPKMITGDNIYIAVETGVRAGIIEKGTPVVLIEGRKQNFIEGQERIFKGIVVERNEDGQAIQRDINISQKSAQYLEQKYPIAVDNDFVMLKPEPYLSNRIKLFSRISPQNKALIVRRLKEQLSEQYQNRPFKDRFFGQLKPKIGMCGDGANDLMAIREADVGLGISDSDASYGASFTIVNMMDVDQIVRDGKATESNVIEMLQYYCTISWLKLVGYTILASDGTSFNGLQTIYFNFIATIWLPMLMGLSRPNKKMNRYSPCSNFMGIGNHLIYWGNVIIPTMGMVAAYLYYTTTTDFVANPKRAVTDAGYSFVNKSNAIVFLIIEIPFVWNCIFIYTSEPFKQKFYKNYLLVFLAFGNVVTSIVLFFLSPFLMQTLFVLKINHGQAACVILIMLSFVALQWFYNQIMKSAEFHKRQKYTPQSNKVSNEAQNQSQNALDESVNNQLVQRNNREADE